MPPDVKVQTGPQAAAEQASDTAGGINDFLTPLLLAFAGAAVFAGAFIIFNTFAITVAQRTREFAMLRTIGASRRQVLRSVLLGGRGDRRAGVADSASPPASASPSCSTRCSTRPASACPWPRSTWAR